MRAKVDSYLALVGIVGGVVLAAYLYVNDRTSLLVTTPIIASLSCLAYLVLHKRLILTVPQSKACQCWGYDIIFAMLFVVSVLVYIFRSDEYVRPLIYFVLLAVMAVVVAVKVILSPVSKKNIVVTLIEIMILGLSTEWSVTLLYPTVIGLDPWWHQWYVGKIISDGGIQMIQQRLPAFHFAIIGVSKFTGFDYRLSAMLSVSLCQVVFDVVIIYLIGSMVADRRIGMLSSLLMAVSNWHMWFGYWTIPNTLGATLALIIIYLVMKYHRDKAVLLLPIIGILCVALLLTHPIATLWVLLALMMLCLCFAVWDNHFIFKVHVPKRLSIILVVFAVSMTIWWNTDTSYWDTLQIFVDNRFNPVQSGYSSPDEQLANGQPIESLSPSVNPLADKVVSPPYHPIEKPMPLYNETWLCGSYQESVFNSSGMILYFALSLIGCLIIVGRRLGGRYGIFVVVFGLLILSIGYFPMLFGMSVIEHRWWYFAQIILSIPLAIILLSLSELTKRLSVRVLIISLLVGGLSFLMLVGLPSNMDNNTFSKNQLVRYVLTNPEVQALYDVNSLYPNAIIGADSYYEMTAKHLLGYSTTLEDWGDSRLRILTDNLLSGNFRDSDAGVILIRDCIVHEPFGNGDGVIYRLGYDPRQSLLAQGFRKVYDNGAVSAFVR